MNSFTIGNSETQQRIFFEFFLAGTAGDIELRRGFWQSRTKTYRMNQSIASREPNELVAFAQRPGGDVFFGINTRKAGVINAKKSDVFEIVCVAVDVDFKTTPQGTAERALKSFCFKPTIVIFSGGGWHLYWLLTSPVLRTDETQAFFEQVGKIIAAMLGGDHCYNANRILRVPGRVNSKYQHQPMCRILSHHGPRYEAADFERFAGVGVRASTRPVEIQPAAAIPPKFQTLLARNPKLRATWEGRRPDLNDQSRSGRDQSMASQLAPRGFTPDEVGAVLIANPHGKGADGSPAYRRLTAAKAFAPRPDSPPGTATSRQSDRETEIQKDCESQTGAGLAEVAHGTGGSNPGDELEGFLKWACRESRAVALRLKETGRWQTESFQFLRLLKGRKEFEKMSRVDLAGSSLWGMTDFSQDEILEACASWLKIKSTANQDRLRDAALWSAQCPVPNRAPFQDNETFMRFLSVAYYLQRSAGHVDEVFLPCHLLGRLLDVSPDTISNYRQVALAEGILVEVRKATPRKATRFRVELAKFQAPEVVH